MIHRWAHALVGCVVAAALGCGSDGQSASPQAEPSGPSVTSGADGGAGDASPISEGGTPGQTRCGASNATAAPIAGGLVALPQTALGLDQATNGGFESATSGWATPPGWMLDGAEKHSGAASLRFNGPGSSATQPITLKKGVYTLSGWVKTQALGGKNSGLRLTLDFRPGVNDWDPTELIGGTMDWTLFERKNIVVPQDRAATISLESYAGPSGAAWVDDVKVEEQLPSPVDAFLLYPNFRGILFEDQAGTVRIDARVTPPGSDFSGYSLVGTIEEEDTHKVIANASVPAAEHAEVDIDGCAMSPGRAYLAKVRLVKNQGSTLVYEAPAYRISRSPAEARAKMHVAFDEKNRILLNGAPRFILGVYDSGMGYTTSEPTWESQLWSPTGERRMEGLAINMYLNYWYGAAPMTSMGPLLDNLAKHGVTYLQTGNCVTQNKETGFAIDADDYAKEFAAHGGAAGFYTADECDSVLANSAFDQRARLAKDDTGTITFGALLAGDDLYMWRDAVDLLSTDPYPMYGAEPAGGYNHGIVADWAIRTRNAVMNARPFVTVLQFFQFTAAGRWPTRTEMRNHAYAAVAEGARGLFWWSIGSNALYDVCPSWCPERTAHMDDLKAVVAELAALEPALLADDAPALLASSSSPAVRTRVKSAAGKTYLIAYNSTNGPVTATFTMANAPSAVDVVGEGRAASPSGTHFEDAFGPFAAHVYAMH